MIFARKISIEARGSLAIIEVPVPLGSHARNDASKRTKNHPYPSSTTIKLGPLFTSLKILGSPVFPTVTDCSYPIPASANAGTEILKLELKYCDFDGERCWGK